MFLRPREQVLASHRRFEHGQLFFKILNEARAFYENNAVNMNKLKSVLEAPMGCKYLLSRAQKQCLVSYYLEDCDFFKLSNLTA